MLYKQLLFWFLVHIGSCEPLLCQYCSKLTVSTVVVLAVPFSRQCRPFSTRSGTEMCSWQWCPAGQVRPPQPTGNAMLHPPDVNAVSRMIQDMPPAVEMSLLGTALQIFQAW